MPILLTCDACNKKVAEFGFVAYDGVTEHATALERIAVHVRCDAHYDMVVCSEECAKKLKEKK